MSYCRFGRDSDVYVFESEAGIECCACALQSRQWFRVRTAAQMIDHLLAHRAVGHAVPQSALDELHADAAADGVRAHEAGR